MEFTNDLYAHFSRYFYQNLKNKYLYISCNHATTHNKHKPGDNNGMSLSKLPALSSQPTTKIYSNMT